MPGLDYYLKYADRSATDKRFAAAMAELTVLEGGLTKDPDDRGNWTGGKVGAGELKGTKCGISAATYPQLDIERLTKAEISAIYYVDFWLALKCDLIMDAAVAFEIFDTGVNCGIGTAVLIAQRSLAFLGTIKPDEVDGRFGAQTLAGINDWCRKYPRCLHKVLNGYQFCHYKDIVEAALKSPADHREKYGPGWMKRIQEYRTEQK